MEELVQKVAELRKGGGNILASDEGAKVIQKLDSIYWKKVEEIVSGALSGDADRFILDKYQRLIVDLGLIDARIIEESQLPRVALLKELYERVGYNILYLSEWLSRRMQNFIVMGTLEENSAPSIQSTQQGATVTNMREARVKIYRLITPLLSNLPGVSQKQVELVTSGKLDDAIDTIYLQLEKGETKELAESLSQLKALKSMILSKAKGRASTPDDYTHFDHLRKLDEAMDEMRKYIKSERAVMKREVTAADKVNFLLSEMRLVKSLMRLGIAGSGLSKNHSTMLSVSRRVTKSKIVDVMNRVKECDPSLPMEHTIMVAPMGGVGFYEWDRDTIFIPLCPSVSIEEAIVMGFASYRIMLDMTQNESRLKKAFESDLSSTNFRSDFTRLYTTWVLKVGSGYKAAMTEKQYEFFKKAIGPSEPDLFGPKELAQQTPEERMKFIKEARNKLSRGEEDYMIRYGLGVIYWKERRPSDALREIAAAVKINPVDPRAMFTLGFLCTIAGFDEKAKKAFEEVLEIAPNTIWQIYAQEYLAKLGG